MGILGGYDASADFWKVLADGTIKNDGRASITFVDADGTTKEIPFSAMGLAKDTMVEGGLFWLLMGRAPKTDEDTSIVQDLMTKSGLIHSGNEEDRDSWRWINGKDGNITTANMDKTINMSLAMMQFGGSINQWVLARTYNDVIDKAATNPDYVMNGFEMGIAQAACERVKAMAMNRANYYQLLGIYTSKYTDPMLNKYYNSDTLKSAYAEIDYDILYGNTGLSSAFYDYIGGNWKKAQDGNPGERQNYLIQPMVGDFERITATTTYGNGNVHLGMLGGTKMDLAPGETGNEVHDKYAVVTTRNLHMDIMAMDREQNGTYTNRTIGWSVEDLEYGAGASYGYALHLFSQGVETIYGHLYEGSIASQMLVSLRDLAYKSGIERMYIPAGTQIGQTGYTGHCDSAGVGGEHLHFEMLQWKRGNTWWR